MNILQRHTAQYFGAMQHGIKRSGKVIYRARGAAANSDLGIYADGRRVQRRTFNYSTQRKSNMKLLDRVLYR